MSIFASNNDNNIYHATVTPGILSASAMKENVRAAGGKVDGILRFSIQWNDVEEDCNDLDAHCIEPTGEEIYFKHKKSDVTSGFLDTDTMRPSLRVGIENITYPQTGNMIKGNYEFFVNCYWYRKGKSGFRAEIECNGFVYQYNYTKELIENENVKVACVYYDGNSFRINHYLTPIKTI